MNNLENSLVTKDKLIVCFKTNSSEDLIAYLHSISRSENVILNDKVHLSRNTNKKEKDIACSVKYNLHYNDDLVGILFFGTDNKEDFFFKVTNKKLYEVKYSVKFLLSLVLTNFPFSCYLNNLTKLDLACDTIDPFTRDNATLVEDQCLNNNYFTNLNLKKQKGNVDLLNGRTIEDAKYKLTVPRLTTSQIKGIVHIGKIQNVKSITIYCKGDFLQDYQESYFHQHFGLDHKIITRVEMKLKSAFFNKKNFDLNKIDDQSYLTDFFKQESTDYLTFNVLNEKMGYDENRNLKYKKLSFLDKFQFKILPNFYLQDIEIHINKGTKTSNIVRSNRARLTKLMKEFVNNKSYNILNDIIEFAKYNSLSYSYKRLSFKDRNHFFDFLLKRFEKVVNDNDFNKNNISQFKTDLKIRLFPKTDKIGNHIVTNQTITIVNRLKNQKYGIEFTKNSNQF